MKLGIYLRVSTRDQNLDGQRAEIMAWLKSQGAVSERYGYE